MFVDKLKHWKPFSRNWKESIPCSWKWVWRAKSLYCKRL